MPDTTEIVVNTGPIIALVAALGDLDVLGLYDRVWVPFEVCQEVLMGGPFGFAVPEFQAADRLRKGETPLGIAPMLANSLD